MAKLTARGEHEVARIKAQLPDSDVQATFVLRSDGAILRKFAGERTWNVWRKVKRAYLPKHTVDGAVLLDRIVVGRGWEVVQ